MDWDRKDDLLSLIAELIDQNTRVLFMANSKKGTRPPEPIFIPRPFVKKVRDASPKALALVFAKLGMRIERDPNSD